MKNLVDLTGRTVIVTGAAQGIGRATCLLALELGANVAAVDLQAEALQSLAAEAVDAPLVTCTGSVSDPAFVQATVDGLVQRFGAVHGLVNGAGIVRAAMIENMSLDQWQQVLDVHLTGSFLWLQAVGRHVIARGQQGDATPCSIVNISSVAGKRGSIGQINYATAKAGMLGMTMSVAREWSKHGIRCNTVCLGPVETPMTTKLRTTEKLANLTLSQVPMGRWAQPEEIARSLCFLLSDAASYTTGQHYGIDGGMHLTS